MRASDLELSDLPPSSDFIRKMGSQFYLWKAYTPTTIEADIPFDQDWWKYAYWMPKIKREFYLMALSAPEFDKALIDKCKSYGMDFWYFSTHYDFMIERMEWMRKQGVTHIGEVK